MKKTENSTSSENQEATEAKRITIELTATSTVCYYPVDTTSDATMFGRCDNVSNHFTLI
jgi:hypothetical protein